MPTKMGTDEKLSDLVGNAKYSINDNLSFNYNFSIDQNYNELNYNEIGTNLELDCLILILVIKIIKIILLQKLTTTTTKVIFHSKRKEIY